MSKDGKLISEGFNKFFLNVGTELDKKIPISNTDPITYLKGSHNETIFLHPSDSEEIGKIVKNLKEGAPGYDAIPANIIKQCKDIFMVPFTHLINLSLLTGVFPDELKVANVV